MITTHENSYGVFELSGPLNEKTLIFDVDTVPQIKRVLQEFGFASNYTLGWIDVPTSYPEWAMNTCVCYWDPNDPEPTDEEFAAGSRYLTDFGTINRYYQGDPLIGFGFKRTASLIEPGSQPTTGYNDISSTFTIADAKRAMLIFQMNNGDVEPLVELILHYVDAPSVGPFQVESGVWFDLPGDTSKIYMFDFSTTVYDGSGFNLYLYGMRLGKLVDNPFATITKLEAQFNKNQFLLVEGKPLMWRWDSYLNESIPEAFILLDETPTSTHTVNFKLKNGTVPNWNSAVIMSNNGVQVDSIVPLANASADVILSGTEAQFGAKCTELKVQLVDTNHGANTQYEANVYLDPWWDATDISNWSSFEALWDTNSKSWKPDSYSMYGGDSITLDCASLAAGYANGVDWVIGYYPRWLRVTYNDSSQVLLNYIVNSNQSSTSYTEPSGTIINIYNENNYQPSRLQFTSGTANKEVTKIEFAPPPVHRQWYDVTDPSYWTVEDQDEVNGWDGSKWVTGIYTETILPETVPYYGILPYGTTYNIGDQFVSQGTLFTIASAGTELGWEIASESQGYPNDWRSGDMLATGGFITWPWPFVNRLVVRVYSQDGTRMYYVAYAATTQSSTIVSDHVLIMHANKTTHLDWHLGAIKIELTTDNIDDIGNVQTMFYSRREPSDENNSNPNNNSGWNSVGIDGHYAKVSSLDSSLINLEPNWFFNRIDINNLSGTVPFNITKIRVYK